MLENNPYIYKYRPLELYPHQKHLFEICKYTHPKLILYTAQTGQGKTLSPIGASNFYDAVIFMCAHRHIALALARAAIAVKKKIATAFGAKSMKPKDWRGASKPQIPGGQFVKVKEKCKTFPYCNQGDINALDLSENKFTKKIIEKLSEEYFIDVKTLSNIILKEINKTK
jgi:hypothetical protein